MGLSKSAILKALRALISWRAGKTSATVLFVTLLTIGLTAIDCTLIGDNINCKNPWSSWV